MRFLSLLLALSLTLDSAAAQAMKLTEVAQGFVRSGWAGAAPADFDRTFVIDYRRIQIIEDGEVLADPFFLSSGEGELTDIWSMAFHPNFAVNGRFYLVYNDTLGDSGVAEFTVDPANPNLADYSSKRVLFGPAYQPSVDHSFGDCFFGFDGLLYVSTGDGGPQFDPSNNAQNRRLPFGKILRLDPDAPAPHVPFINPWVLDPGGLDAAIAYGLRMPWRMTIDALTGDFYLADVGQSMIEEVNVLPFDQVSGKNFGWRCREGNQCSNFGGCECSDPNLVEPVLSYDHAEGRCAVIGGKVYRGGDLPWLDGRYFFADFCTREIQSFRFDGSGAVDLRNHSAELQGFEELQAPSSFGTDARGELLIVDIHGELYRVEPILPEPWPEFCFGDGECVACPCGNDEASGVRAGCRNDALGRGARLSVQGWPSLTSHGLRFDLRRAAPSSFAVLLSAPNRLPAVSSGPCLPGSGIQAIALDGLRCIGGGLTRHGVRPVDVNGAVGLDTPAWEGTPGMPFGALEGFVPGQVRHFQVFYRVDPTSGCGTGQGTTQGVSQVFAP